MRLQEEYLKRHGIDIPIVYHTLKTNVILCSKPHTVLSIEWRSNVQHPGIYDLHFLTPIHNGYTKNIFFEENSNYICTYQDFMSYMVRWADNLEVEPVPSKEVDLAIFEMFLLCYDGWLSKPWLDTAYKVVDSEYSVEERLGFLREFVSQLISREWLVFKIYENDFERYKYNYADWLVNLIKVKNAGN